MTWKVPVGITYKETVYHNFENTPHLVGGGTTRYGKTNLIKSLMTSLILNNPENAKFYLIDLKAGVEFYKYRNLRQVKGVATDVYETHDLLTDVLLQLESTQYSFREKGYSNITETPIKKRTFIIIDEAGDLVPERFMPKKDKDMYAECQWMLAHIARIGGAFGFRELLFSQYTTADVLPRQIKQNCDAKISFKLQNAYSSEVVLGEGNTQAADLPKIKGRAIFKDGADLYELQVPLITDEVMEELLAEHYGGVSGEVEIIGANRKADEDIDGLIRFRNIN